MNEDGVSPPMDDPGWGGAFDIPVKFHWPDLFYWLR
jgi:hypothetical protein